MPFVFPFPPSFLLSFPFLPFLLPFSLLFLLPISLLSVSVFACSSVPTGKSLERMATMEPAEFERKLLKSSPESVALPADAREPAIFSSTATSLFRSQLDARCGVRGTVFDLKTRATLPVRMQHMPLSSAKDYRIVTRSGTHFSFERERFDMVRSAFLKFIFQCRIGHMDGVMVCYHNTERIFGYEFIALDLMERVVFGK